MQFLMIQGMQPIIDWNLYKEAPTSNEISETALEGPVSISVQGNLSSDEFIQLLSLITRCDSIVSIRIKDNFLFTERSLNLLTNKIFEINLLKDIKTKVSFEIDNCNVNIINTTQLDKIFHTFKYVTDLRIINPGVDFWSWSPLKGIRYMPIGEVVADKELLRASVLKTSQIILKKKENDESKKRKLIFETEIQSKKIKKNNNNSSSEANE